LNSTYSHFHPVISEEAVHVDIGSQNSDTVVRLNAEYFVRRIGRREYSTYGGYGILDAAIVGVGLVDVETVDLTEFTVLLEKLKINLFQENSMMLHF
jgi:hypothetical protein